MRSGCDAGGNAGCGLGGGKAQGCVDTGLAQGWGRCGWGRCGSVRGAGSGKTWSFWSLSFGKDRGGTGLIGWIATVAGLAVTDDVTGLAVAVRLDAVLVIRMAGSASGDAGRVGRAGFRGSIVERSAAPAERRTTGGTRCGMSASDWVGGMLDMGTRRISSSGAN
ncbi:MAG: hypothetical protein WCS20_09155 [Alphaproteobacteria bacterium]